MPQTKLGESIVNTIDNLPAVGTIAPHFVLTKNNLTDVASETFLDRKLVLNIFPSIDTRVCSTLVREFNKRITSYDNTLVLCIAKDLPFAMRKFCGAEGIDKAITLSDFRNYGFGKNYGVELIDGAFKGLLARAVVVIDASWKIKYTELVPSIYMEPDYESALKAL